MITYKVINGFARNFYQRRVPGPRKNTSLNFGENPDYDADPINSRSEVCLFENEIRA